MADWSVLAGWSVFTSVAVWGAFDSQNFLRCAQCEKISFRTFKEPLFLSIASFSSRQSGQVDGLAACRLTPRQDENTKKRICEVFQNYGLKITIEANKKIVNFLDVTLDLRNDSYKPYKKPNDNVSYIHKCSNHPPVVIKNLPKSIMKRINTNSKNEEIFKHAAPIYTEALKRSGFNQNFKFNIDKEENNKNKEDRKKRSRKITCFTPPFSDSVSTNVAKTFLSMIDRQLPKDEQTSQNLQQKHRESQLQLYAKRKSNNPEPQQEIITATP
ncbi:inositol hexakisphosphate and diphosphoinositol-pentakisphosphate kinase 2 [Elysia marginata]|uniref:Inositol hexakisphosphate and diphosphoinositol-pentakisphosphate kinase 2 n=1 Tax=Elysia marginata TaxID=1093978 RepID=A0AAV4HDQ6_9GAST|nr:inositol hexakisphosphate and diphosphoinositol-pentakisphosphate kinase 2 [Elysia marginata]